MKAWTITDVKTIDLDEADGQISQGMLKVKVTDVVLTHTDFALYAGRDKARLPVIPGRLAVGLVSESGGDSTFAKGERVLLSPYHNGKVRGLDMDGYLSDYTIINKDDVISLPAGLDSKAAVFADLIATAIRAIDKLKVESGEFVAIMGADDFCLIAAQIVDYYHAIPIVVSTDSDGLDIATELGVTYVIDSSASNTEQRVRNITNGAMCECAIVQSYAGRVQNGLNLAGKQGRVCIIGPDEYVGDLPCDLHNMVSKRLNISTVTNGGKHIPAAINFLATKNLTVEGMPTRYTDFDAIGQLFSEISSGQLFGPLTVVHVD